MKDDLEYTTPLQCKILTYKLNETDLEVIQRDIEKYCNDGYFNYRVISQISTTIENNLYIATVVYENKFKWFRNLEKLKCKECENCKNWKYCLGGSLHNWDFDNKTQKLCLNKILEGDVANE